jgi:hypothetical protein
MHFPKNDNFDRRTFRRDEPKSEAPPPDDTGDADDLDMQGPMDRVEIDAM